MRSANTLEDIWKHNKLLVAKKSPHKLHFVCLEGSCGTGKADLLGRLQRQGFRTVVNRYYEHAMEMRCTTGSSRSATQAAHQIHQHLKQGGVHGIRGKGAFMAQPMPLLSAHLWAAKLIDALREHSQAKAGGVVYKENTVFVHRSLLTPVVWIWMVFFSSFFCWWARFMELSIILISSMKSAMSTTSHWLAATLIRSGMPQWGFFLSIKIHRQAERVGERLYWAEGIEKEIRTELENEEKMRLTNELYELYERRGYFDAMLPTTSTKQVSIRVNLIVLLSSKFLYIGSSAFTFNVRHWFRSWQRLCWPPRIEVVERSLREDWRSLTIQSCFSVLHNSVSVFFNAWIV